MVFTPYLLKIQDCYVQGDVASAVELFDSYLSSPSIAYTREWMDAWYFWDKPWDAAIWKYHQQRPSAGTKALVLWSQLALYMQHTALAIGWTTAQKTLLHNAALASFGLRQSIAQQQPEWGPYTLMVQWLYDSLLHEFMPDTALAQIGSAPALWRPVLAYVWSTITHEVSPADAFMPDEAYVEEYVQFKERQTGLLLEDATQTMYSPWGLVLCADKAAWAGEWTMATSLMAQGIQEFTVNLRAGQQEWLYWTRIWIAEHIHFLQSRHSEHLDAWRVFQEKLDTCTRELRSPWALWSTEASMGVTDALYATGYLPVVYAAARDPQYPHAGAVLHKEEYAPWLYDQFLNEPDSEQAMTLLSSACELRYAPALLEMLKRFLTGVYSINTPESDTPLPVHTLHALLPLFFAGIRGGDSRISVLALEHVGSDLSSDYYYQACLVGSRIDPRCYMGAVFHAMKNKHDQALLRWLPRCIMQNPAMSKNDQALLWSAYIKAGLNVEDAASIRRGLQQFMLTDSGPLDAKLQKQINQAKSKGLLDLA